MAKRQISRDEWRKLQAAQANIALAIYCLEHVHIPRSNSHMRDNLIRIHEDLKRYREHDVEDYLTAQERGKQAKEMPDNVILLPVLATDEE